VDLLYAKVERRSLSLAVRKMRSPNTTGDDRPNGTATDHARDSPG
jgi:hypothetical protein